MMRSSIPTRGQRLVLAYLHLECGMMKVEEGKAQVALVKMEAWGQGLGKAVVRVEDLKRERTGLGR